MFFTQNSFAVIPFLLNHLLQIFAHDTQAMLSCNVQKFVAMTLSESWPEQNEISFKFAFCMKKHKCHWPMAGGTSGIQWPMVQKHEIQWRLTVTYIILDNCHFTDSGAHKNIHKIKSSVC